LLGRASGNYVVMDPNMICKKAKRNRGKLAEICKNETSLLKHIEHGTSMGAQECGYQFRSRPWNCTMIRKSIRKILMKGKFNFV
jgi:wingless-type MMTV integration site family, member 6